MSSPRNILDNSLTALSFITTMIDNPSTYYDSHTPYDRVTAHQQILPEISVLSAFSAPVATPLFVASREVEHFANFCALVGLKESVDT
jgi:hypothetical protein